MRQLRTAPDGTVLQVVSPDAPPLPVHPLWLRERCRDAASVDARTQQRLYNPADLDPASSIARIAEPVPGQFDVQFSDGHGGCFAAADILAELADGDGLPSPEAWDETAPPPVAVDWRDCADAPTLVAALREFLCHGYIIFTHVPSRPGAVLEVARRFGHVRETNFGALFDVRSILTANDLAYTSLPLDPHTDNPYRAPVPGIQLLHCLINETPGGLSTLVDGLAVAEMLRSEAPDEFASLAGTRVRFRYVDAEAELIAYAPLIALDVDGGFEAIHYSPRLDFVPLLPPDRLELFFSARRRLDRMLKSDRFERRFRLADGELMMFDNRRLLHGRTGFDPAVGLRHLQGCYIDADGPRSLYRVLRRDLV
jgi:gamma-butyrobetaine dioxygenase